MVFMDELYLGGDQAAAVVFIINFLVWTTGAFIIYWVVICLTSVFNTGLIRYLKERTITGHFIRWFIGLFKNARALVETVDFRDKSTKTLLKIVGLDFLLLSVISSFWFYGIFGLFVYSVILFYVLRKLYFNMQDKYQILLKATNQLAEGNLEVDIKEALGVFEPFRGEIEKIQSGFKKAVEEEVKSQSMKTELITNVSHDLKTPLTAIITYVNLLKKQDITEEERSSYIQVLDQKSMRLKHLIEDLFEVSKANSRTVILNPVEVDIEEKDGEVIVSMKNISATEISLNGAELSDRFVRGDVSRGTEGSGLGLAIAKSFVELQKGRFEVVVEADLFKVLITWKGRELELPVTE